VYKLHKTVLLKM